MPTLSKSKYTLSCQCQKALWLRQNKPSEAVVDASLQTRFAAGQTIGELAKQRFQGAVDATVKVNGQLDISAMIAKTQQLMAAGCEAICEAAFSCPNHYCAVDVLEKAKDGSGWIINEVKSSTSYKDVYATDVAYQRWVLEQCGVKVVGTKILVVNSSYVRQGDLDVNNLFTVIDISAEVANEYLKVPNQTKLALSTLSLAQEPNMPLSKNCQSPYGCAFWDYCTKHLPKPSVFNVYGSAAFSFAKKLDCYHNGLWSYQDLSTKSWGKIQDMQISCTLNNSCHLNQAGIKEFLNKITYPLYFLDFESMQHAIPQYDNTRPYMQLCFQYSLHYIEHDGGPLLHKAFLAPSDGKDPRRALAEQLCRDIPCVEGLCIMAYNDPFEKTRIREMAQIYPNLHDHLMYIHDHIIDLLVPFRAGHYYLPAMGGSFSIKSVLPALFPDDPDLNYHNLSPLVQNGGDAMTIFPQMHTIEPEKEKEARQALLDYCKLDTLAMVKIWQRLIEILKP